MAKGYPSGSYLEYWEAYCENGHFCSLSLSFCDYKDLLCFAKDAKKYNCLEDKVCKKVSAASDIALAA